MPRNEKEAKRIAEGSAVEIGRAIEAEYAMVFWGYDSRYFVYLPRCTRYNSI